MRMYAGVFHAKTVHILVCTTHPAGEYSPAVHTYASSRGVLPSPACNKWWLVGGRSYIISRGVLLSRIAFVYHIWPGSTPQPCPSPMFCACLAGEYSQPCISWLLVNASGRGVLPSRALWAQWVVVACWCRMQVGGRKVFPSHASGVSHVHLAGEYSPATQTHTRACTLALSHVARSQRVLPSHTAPGSGFAFCRGVLPSHGHANNPRPPIRFRCSLGGRCCPRGRPLSAAAP